jgi:anion-transporting  ArsA/GET3 family ATPase
VTPRVSICCGVGGTGKTTTSAALAVSAALAGERVVVLTIDPARRLADALGVGELTNTPRPVTLDGAAGTLHAAMLDRKGTWDEVIRRHATPDVAERLFANRYYRAVSTRLSGSQEYMAVEKLYDLVQTGAWDHLVIDTPPTQHVLDFFRAPERVQGILDQSMLKLLLEPQGLRGVAARGALAVVESLAGDRVMSEIREFFTLIGGLSAGFRERSAAVATLLAAPGTGYWLVTDAEAPERNDLLGFLEELRTRGLAFRGFLVNRVRPEVVGPFPDPEALRAAFAEVPGGAEAAAFLVALPEQELLRARSHRKAIRDLAKAGGADAWAIPELPGGVRSLAGLRALAPHLPPHPPATPAP